MIMECNKEEAMRAKDIAEKRMQNQDFIGARKFALKAEQLYPSIENISQMLTICDVHISAGCKVNGQMDWYGVLQVELRADDLSIKKQYRKLALLLHPDKNQLPGAEAAFKLIGEAHMILSDRSKRGNYDSKRNKPSKVPPTRQHPQSSSVKTQTQSNFNTVNFSGIKLQQQQQQSSFSNFEKTFWTICPVCGIRYQYYRSILNRSLRCHNCLHSFVAYDMNDMNVKPMSSVQPPSSSHGMQNNPSQKVNSNDQQSQSGDAFSVKSSLDNGREHAVKTTTLTGRKRKGVHSNGSVSDNVVVQNGRPIKHGTSQYGTCRSGDETDFGPKMSPVQSSFDYPDPEFGNFDKLRDASQFFVNQIWALYDSNDGMPRFYVQIKKVCSPGFMLFFTWLEHNPKNEAEAAWTNAELPVACGNFTLGETESTEDRLLFSHVVSWTKGKSRDSYDIYPRKGDVWAIYKGWSSTWSSNTEIAQLYEYEIVEILSDFALGSGVSVIPLVWLEDTVSLFVRAKENEMPPFVIPPNEILRFSHYVPSYKLMGTEREGIPEDCLELDCASLPINFTKMFPSVNCSISTIKNVSGSSWSSLKSTMDERQTGTNTFQETKKSTSHGSLSNGMRKDDDLKNEHSSISQNLKPSENVHSEAKFPEVDTSVKENIESERVHGSVNGKDDSLLESPFSPAIYEYPDPEFYNFEQGKTIASVQCGQIWAFYSDVDSFPKYYGLVKETELHNFRVKIAWLDNCPCLAEERRWHKEGMPIGCGTFEVVCQYETFDDTHLFSHLTHAKLAGKINHYLIEPGVGEIWAVYKNWSIGWSISDLKNCEYILVEICEHILSGMKVNILAKVNGYRSVFKPEGNAEVVTSMEIPVSEYIRFSHQIPAFRLTEERGGELRGYWELDPACVPGVLLVSDQEMQGSEC
ncbi:uncharacterized protein LOC122033673 [Zingiber officinale]|uniref:uncharacterized protein LOC122033673 n=1 Tax=Zingiber officinale TaxID=94328 RepID=UPI001C4B0899|nr:uncharacterized protein LOC122033673 [Zingiber officinale]XP_042448718.1 uncharacterized protein LOC122033673 [Zingiber officinale]XP_042448728.1 uncharacterized protein LOC122033673 [Zingiber officinale]XP_042448735.1 uncharacterized protein LOC122033673 [Zingiber officinale]XP_042448741.1 uncharacterized protein LOC122033673 [Zingiber officinale]